MSKIELYRGDCLEEMKKIPNKSIDLILCDLPYGCTHNKVDTPIPLDLLWKQYERVIKNHGAVLLFSQGLFYIDLVNSNRKLFRYDLIWDKILVSGFLNAKRMPLRQHEQVAVFYKKSPTYNPQMVDGKPLHSKGKKYLDAEIVNNNYNDYKALPDTRSGNTKKYPKSIISFQKPHPSVAVHPTQKPIELLEYLIKTYSNEGDLVLDNCMGSGSTGIACKNLNRNFIGIELDKNYFEIAKNRIELA